MKKFIKVAVVVFLLAFTLAGGINAQFGGGKQPEISEVIRP